MRGLFIGVALSAVVAAGCGSSVAATAGHAAAEGGEPSDTGGSPGEGGPADAEAGMPGILDIMRWGRREP